MNQNNQSPLKPEIIDKQSLTKKLKAKGSQIVIGTLNIFTQSVDSSKPEKYLNYKKKKVFDLSILLIVLGLVGTSFFFWFIFKAKSLPIDLQISLQQSEAKSGQEITYQIKYENNSDRVIKDLNLSLKLPENFYLTQTPPNFNLENKSIYIGDLLPGANNQLEIKGQIWGEVGKEQALMAILSCGPGEEKKYTQCLARHEVILKDSLMQIDVSLPDKIFNQSDFEINLNYYNQTKTEIEQLKLNFDWPENFTLISYDDGLIQRAGEWQINNVQAGQQGSFKLIGRVSYPQQDENQQIDLKWQGKIVLQDQEILQQQDQKNLELNFPKLNVKLETLNNLTNLSLGQEAEFKLTCLNQEDINLTNLKLKVDLPTRYFNLATAQGENLNLEDQTIVFNLADLKIGQQGEFNFKVKTWSNVDFKSQEENLYIVIQPKAEYQLADENYVITAMGDKLNLPLNSKLTLIAQARYFTPQGDQLGIGPLPPQVGLATRYWVFLHGLNTTNQVNDVTIQGFLSQQADWTQRTSVSQGQAFTYDPQIKQFTWQIGDLKPHTGQVYPEAQAAFEVEIIPQITDVGQTLSLIDNLTMSGVDNFTGKRLSLSLGKIDTQLENDELVTGLGQVQP
ncbi:MAG: hypothetical protein PHS07_04050 [Patescibacteria group bacterium]|nr:hypothetical protein [Patescibacteria group bacterium]